MRTKTETGQNTDDKFCRSLEYIERHNQSRPVHIFNCTF